MNSLKCLRGYCENFLTNQKSYSTYKTTLYQVACADAQDDLPPLMLSMLHDKKEHLIIPVITHNPKGVFPPYRSYSHATKMRGDARRLIIVRSTGRDHLAASSAQR